MHKVEEIQEKLMIGERPSPEEWEYLAINAPSPLLFHLADRKRFLLHPEPTVTYIIDRNINYTNVCVSECAFCAFYRKHQDRASYLLPAEVIYRKTKEALLLNASGILLQGGLNPDIPLKYFEDLLSGLKRRFPIYLHCFSPPEILFYSRTYGLSTIEFLLRMKESGMDSLPGGGAEILEDGLRRKLSNKGSSEEWLEVSRQSHLLGIPTTATMVLGLGEDNRQRLQHLQKLYLLQQETQGIVAFIPWTFQPGHTALYPTISAPLPGETYLRWLALSRLYLENVPHLQVSRLTQGMEIARRGLHCGADDLGSIMIEENVVASAGAGHRADEAALQGAIRQEGFHPQRRNAIYARW